MLLVHFLGLVWFGKIGLQPPVVLADFVGVGFLVSLELLCRQRLGRSGSTAMM